VADVSGYGGYSKEYQAKIKPEQMKALGITVDELFESLQKGNSNTGGAYIEKDNKAFTIRGIGLVKSLEDISNTVIETRDGIPVLVKDVAEVELGSALRYGALTMNGNGDVVGGSILMLKGANGNEVIRDIKKDCCAIILDIGIRTGKGFMNCRFCGNRKENDDYYDSNCFSPKQQLSELTYDELQNWLKKDVELSV
jgi:Cu/Ag efflux pump CusA